MADCSISGTALDRAVQAAVAASTAQGPSAASAATKALGQFLGETAPTAASGQVMPLAPPVVGPHAPAAAAPAAVADSQHAPMGQHHQQHYQSHHQQQHFPARTAAPIHHQHHHPQMMMQQQQAMMMQMHAQQQQMAAMVQFQKMQQHQQQQQRQQLQHQQQRTAAAATQQESEAAVSEAHSATQDGATIYEDDVATVSEDERLHHEGLTEDASIERLARAWRDAEAEFAEEFGDDEYDVSDLGGVHAEGHGEAGVADATNANAVDPQYEFSEASRAHGCLVTGSTDIAPQSLSFPDNLYERGLAHFDEGDIRSAILCFESTLRNVDPEHADAWRMLGKCHAENDEDARAIVCWRKALERDPFSTETLLAVGVACVNELDHDGAVESLRGWVAHHPSYAGMPIDSEGVEDPYADDADGRGAMAGMRDVERLLLRALDHDGSVDAAADVHEALGVVYNVSRDYSAAADAFRRAIAVRPDDYQLHNRLGATLANSNRSDEALPSYRAALRLKPRYARGWLNMAISHSNLHNYQEAARCYLQTLSLNPDAGHVWGYLRIALTCDERWDLLPAAAARDLAAFREHFDFVEY